MPGTVLKSQESDVRLSLEDIRKYLTIYLGPADWDAGIKKLHLQLANKNPKHKLNEVMRAVISCAILLPKYDDIKVPSEPTKVLFWAQTPANQMQRDWFEALQKEMAYDREIEQNRHIVSTLGVIHPIDYSPITRQAFNWMYARGLETGHINDENKKVIEQKYKNLVSIYGGQVICNVINKDSRTKPILKNVINWYSGYFFERLIYSTYPLESIIKIKQQELTKTNKDLIKKLTKK